jgi:hypothetical protein
LSIDGGCDRAPDSCVGLCAARPALKGLGIGQPGGLSDAKIGSGLKEALRVGIENTVT